MTTVLGDLADADEVATQRPQRVYPCPTCHKTFKRNEHCIRHERGHRKEKPFSCKLCNRKYARKDLVSRHERSFHPLGALELLQQLQRSPREEPERNSSSTGEGVLDSNVASAEPRLGSAEQPSVPTTTVLRRDSATFLHLGNSDPPATRETDSSANHNQNLVSVTTENYPDAALQVLSSNIDGTSEDEPAEAQTTSFEFNEIQRANPDPETMDIGPIYPQSAEASTTISDAPIQGEFVPGVWDPNQADEPNAPPEQYQPDNQGGQWAYLDAFNERDNFGAGTSSMNLMGNIYSQASRQEANSMDFDFSTLFSHTANPFVADAPTSAHLFNLASPATNNGGTHQIRTGNRRQMFFPAQLPDRLSPSSTESARNLNGPWSQSSSEFGGPLAAGLPIDDLTYETIETEIQECLAPDQQSFTLPSASKLRQLTVSYFNSFHYHFPILHSHTLTTETIYTPLILAIAAIGALYRLNRVTATALWRAGQALIEDDLLQPDHMTPLPIQIAQARLLLTMFAVFSGQIEDAVAGTKLAGFWTTEYRLHKLAMASRKSQQPNLSWPEWLSLETQKRLLCGIFMLSSLLTVTYDTNPFLSVTHDLNVAIPEPEARWEATSAEEWDELPHLDTSIVRPTVREGMIHLLFDKPLPDEFSMKNRDIWSGFATSIVMHAVNVHMWHIMQVTQSFTNFIIDEGTLGHSMVAEVELALVRCYQVLTSSGDQVSNHSKRPQFFNCRALLRSAYVRIFTGSGSFDRIMLLSNNEAQISESIQRYVQTPQTRNEFLTKAVSTAYGGLLMPISAGSLLVRKTAALSWSVEHAIAAWDCALFVTKWIHGIETRQTVPVGPPNAAELENLKKFRTLLDEVESDYESSGSLAADVASVWAAFLDDAWVWSVTPRMANILRQLSKAYTEDWKTKSGQVLAFGNAA